MLFPDASLNIPLERSSICASLTVTNTLDFEPSSHLVEATITETVLSLSIAPTSPSNSGISSLAFRISRPANKVSISDIFTSV